MLKPTKLFSISVLIVFSLILAACNFPGAGNSPSNIAAEQTSVAQTVVALQTQMSAGSTAQPPVVVNTTEAVLPTVTLTLPPPPPTATSTIAATPMPTYKVSNVVDVNYPDNTVVKPNTAFKKTWRVTNGGSGTWNANFKLVFVSGDAMGGPASKPIGQVVAPGQTVDISVDLTSPATPKTYNGKWMLQTDAGATFGTGNTADGVFWVQIKVEQFFAVTGAVTVPVPTVWNGACPLTLAITANITSTAPGTVTYLFKTPLGNSATLELKFDAAGTKTTPVYSVIVPSSMAVIVSTYIDKPNHQEFAPVTVGVTCVP
jgi:hypothetical protein